MSCNKNRIRSAGAENFLGRTILITGGAGFIGVNAASYCLDRGMNVIVLDNLSRDGTEYNIEYLKDNYSSGLEIVVGDILEDRLVDELVSRCDMVLHFAAQVAVTTSIEDPVHDFRVNCQGTLNVLEAIRKQKNRPGLLFTSTNKVYGDLGRVELNEAGSSYYPADPSIGKNGIDESQPLNLYSPYGCSKGAADQYVLDYARIFDVPAVVFRMSCIYGPYQLGTEDQGWVAHFIMQALRQQDITIYGNGKQVRDLLHVHDLLEAMLLAQQNMDKLKGQAFNIGGGRENCTSVIDLVKLISSDHVVNFGFGGWRQGDQFYYVSNFDKFQRMTGWRPSIHYKDGVKELSSWMYENSPSFSQPRVGTGE